MTMATPQDGFAATSHGGLHYLHQGDGPPLILLHSNGQSAHSFTEASGLLAQRFHVYAMDLPGQGDSDPLPRHYSMEDYADSVVAFMDTMGLATAHVAGSSIGGFIAIGLGVRNPGRMEKLVVVESLLRERAGWIKGWAQTEQSFSTLSHSEREVASRLNRPVTPELLSRWNIDRAKAGAWSMVHVMWAVRNFDAVAAINQMTTPAVFAVGENGNVIKSFAERRGQLPPGLELRVIGNSSHFPMLDNPAGFASVIEQFCLG